MGKDISHAEKYVFRMPCSKTKASARFLREDGFQAAHQRPFQARHIAAEAAADRVPASQGTTPLAAAACLPRIPYVPPYRSQSALIRTFPGEHAPKKAVRLDQDQGCARQFTVPGKALCDKAPILNVRMHGYEGG